jgi:ubiquinone/menaquinone biosynthesis C-methylase UbiE
MDQKAHWESIYTTKAANEVSWYQNRLDTSLELVRRTGLSRDAAILDVGGGASTLVDDLLQTGFHDITIVDLSAIALEKSKTRLGVLSRQVHWIEGEISNVQLENDHYELWHDRAVFHFMTKAEDRSAYIDTATRTVTKGGFLIMATFGLGGPTQCSGLPVERYGPQELARQFPAFTLVDTKQEEHRTPSGSLQNFTYILMQK